MNILIIGGTRNIGHYLALRLFNEGHRVTVLNRGLTRDELPASIARLRCDRTETQQLRRALSGRTFDAVVDTVLYKGTEAESIVDILSDSTGHYIFVSTGQVYLVAQEVRRPAREADYDSPLVSPPEPDTYDYEEWLYGMDKRQAEDVLAAAWRDQRFPYTALRLPMVNSERDAFLRLYGYFLRLKDGGPILVPDQPAHPLRHVYVHDIVQAIITLVTTGQGKGRAYNIGQDETLTLDQFLGIMGEAMNVQPKIVTVERDLLEANGFLPDCSPFSDRWMSELDNTLSKTELGLTYTPASTCIERIVAHYSQQPPPPPVSYRRRSAEKNLLHTISSG